MGKWWRFIPARSIFPDWEVTPQMPIVVAHKIPPGLVGWPIVAYLHTCMRKPRIIQEIERKHKLTVRLTATFDNLISPFVTGLDRLIPNEAVDPLSHSDLIFENAQHALDSLQLPRLIQGKSPRSIALVK